MSPETARLARIMAECECKLWDIARTMEISIGDAWTVVMPLIRQSPVWHRRAIEARSRRKCRRRLHTPAILSYPQDIPSRDAGSVVYIDCPGTSGAPMRPRRLDD